MVTLRFSRFRKSSSLSVVKRLKCPFIRCDTSGWAMPKTSAISRCFSCLSSRILKTWNPICARARSWSAFLRPRSAKTFPEPSSNSTGFRLFVLMRQFLCFGVSLADQLNVPLRGFNAFLRLLLEGVQNVNPPADLNRQHHAVGVRRRSQGNFKNTAANTLERLGVLRHPTKLDELKLITQQFLCVIREITKVLFRVSEPDKRP